MARDADDGGRTMPNHDSRTSSNKPLLFYKLMVASIVHDDKLKIPGKVAKRIEQELSIVVTVSVPDGRKWNMKLGKGGGKCWFGDGWVEFMRHYNVRVGYLLVFRFKGDSMFVVNIFNLSNAEIQYLADSSGAAESRDEKKCSISKGNSQCGTVDEQKKLDSVAVKEDKLCVLALLAEGKKKLDSAEVSVDELCSVTGGKEYENDGTQKIPYLSPQGFAAGASQTQNMSGNISGLLQTKLAEMNDEILSQIKNANGGYDEIQQKKQCSLNESQNLSTDITMNMLVPEMILQGKQCYENNGPVNDITLKESSFRNLEDENLCSLTRQTESANNDTQKKSDVPQPGFVKPAKQTSGNEKGESSLGGVENETKPSSGGGSPSSSLLVKDVTPGYYRANIMSLEKKKPKMRKRKIPPPATATNDGSGFIADTLNSLGKMELTPDKHIISKTSINVPIANSLTTAARSGASSHMGTIPDGDDKKHPELDKLFSETHVPTMIMNNLPGSELNLQTPVKRRQEKNIADLLNNTGTIKVLAGQKADISPADVLDFTLEKTGKEQKKQKTMQLSAISNPPINPFFMVPMRVSYVQKKGLLNIPYNFASKYLQKTSGFATLQNLEGNQWTVRVICNSQGRVKFSQGWYKFATDNYLKEGDMCLFELVDSVNTLLIVTFIRSPKVPPPADPEVLKL